MGRGSRVLMLDGAIFQQEWLGIGFAALIVVAVLWLMKTLIKWLLIFAIVGFCLWHFWLS
ncbi:MAG TPA: hypothetical protein PLY88_08515 [Candidatus Omnitrophota bacterium]|nr:hypothetical protein [Candidatus Omnitrophota bacterium]